MKYFAPTSLKEFFKLRLKFQGEQLTILAGGTDLMPRYEQELPLPDHLIDLKHIADLHSISVTENELTIGTLTTIQELQDHPIIQAEFNALFEASHDFAGAQIRHRGTIGGNICNASPAGDLLPALYAFDARITLIASDGERQVSMHNFIQGPGRTDLQEDELLGSITLKRNHLKSKFQKVGLRQSMAISVVNLAYVWDENKEGMNSLRIAAGAVAPTIVNLDAFSSAYLKSPNDLLAHMSLIDAAISPIDDIRATAKYRRTVLKNLIKDFLSE